MDNVQGQISEDIFKVKWRLLCLLLLFATSTFLKIKEYYSDMGNIWSHDLFRPIAHKRAKIFYGL